MLHQYLIQEFEKRSGLNPKYSLRAFARDLNIHSGTLSGILNQRRAVGAKVLKHILKSLPLTTSERRKILSEIIAGKELNSTVPPLLDEETLAIVQDWEHFAILAFLQLKNKKHSAGEISRDFNLDPARTLRVLNNLEKAGLLSREGNKIVSQQKSLMTSRGIPSPALREAHRQYIDKAKESLEKVGVQERDITGTTMAISSKNLPKAKELIQQFRSDLSELLEHGTPDEVYRLNIQLFPLTHKKTKEVLK